MNWLQKIAQPQMMLPFSNDINYYHSMPSTYQQSPQSNGNYQCAYCEDTISPEKIGVWIDTGLNSDSFGTQELQFNIDRDQIQSQLEIYFQEANKQLEEFANNLEIIDTDPKDIAPGRVSDVQYWNKPLSRDQISSVRNALATLLNTALSGGNDKRIINPQDSIEYRRNNTIFNAGIVPTINDFNTLGEARNVINSRRTRIDDFIDNFISRYETAKQREERPVCEDCSAEHIGICENCGEYAIDGIEAGNGDMYCEDCSSDLIYCEGCYEKYPEDTITSYGSDDTYEGVDITLCEHCLSNSNIYTCDNCHTNITNGDNAYSTDYGFNCPDCYEENNGKLLDTGKYNRMLIELGLNEIEHMPFIGHKITNVFIPFFEKWRKRYGEICNNTQIVLNEADKMNIKDNEILMSLKFLSERYQMSTPIIEYLQKILQSNSEWKEKYPELKNMKNIPAKFKAVKSYGDPDVDHMTITMKPTDDLLNFAEIVTDKAKEMWHELNSGHHRGSIAYARIGESEDGKTWIINNIQTDADVQKLNKSQRARWQDILNQLQKKKHNIDMADPITQAALAMSFWNKTLRNWQPLLIDVIIQLAKTADKELYITPMEMQREKWSTVPNRAIDAYERIPEQMGGQREEKYVKPESLEEGQYELIRLAQTNWMVKLCQTSEPDYNQLGRMWNVSPEVAKSGVMYLAILGYPVEQTIRMSVNQLQRCFL